MTIPRFSATVTARELTLALAEQGCAIVERLASSQDVSKVLEQIGPFLDRAPVGSGSFVGRQTRRTARVIAKSSAARHWVTQPLLLDTLASCFKGECYDFQLHSTHAVRIEPGEREQSLHRDDGVFPFKHPCPPCHINTIWALTDFAADNGATRVVPGSQRWDDTRRPLESECEIAEMPRGSVLIIDAATYHGGGRNRSATPRTGMILGYSLGWLRQEENQYLAVPPALARTLPRRLRELVGYKNHGFLGHFEGRSPEYALADFVSDVASAEDLFTPELEALVIRRR